MPPLDPVNTFVANTYYSILGGFNPSTGEYINLFAYGAVALGDNPGDTNLSDGSAGNGTEATGEPLSWDGVLAAQYSGWTVGGAPVVQAEGAYYLVTDDTGLGGTSGFAVSTPTFNYPNPSCFLPGTKIATPFGERAIESLQIGELITTASGAQKSVVWLARMTVPLTRFNHESMLPICIKQEALGNGLPHRDLFVSNDHAFAIDGVLVIAGVLVNGTTIVRCDDFAADVIEYFHIEVEDHDLLLAEGAAAETFSGSNRERFDNAAEFHALYPDAAPGKLMTMGRVTQARQLPKALRSKFTKVA